VPTAARRCRVVLWGRRQEGRRRSTGGSSL
jgi:hypothetical protein